MELIGVKDTTADVASTVVRPPWLLSLLVETEKTTRPSEVAMGVAEAGVEMATASVVGALVAVVRLEVGGIAPSGLEKVGVDDDGTGGWETGSTVVEPGGGLLLGTALVSLDWRLAMRRREVARGASSECTASRAVRSWEKTPSWNLEDQRWRAE